MDNNEKKDELTTITENTEIENVTNEEKNKTLEQEVKQEEITTEEKKEEPKIESKINNRSSNDLRPRKWLLWILVVITIFIVGFLVYQTVFGIKSALSNSTGSWGIFNLFKRTSTIEDEANNIINQAKNEINNAQEQEKKEEFNNNFDIYAGTGWGDEVGRLLDRIIKNNKTNESGRLVTLVYGNETTTDPVRIKEIKRTFEDFHDYEVTIDYDENGYVNKVTVEY